jgi:hypothetical protein
LVLSAEILVSKVGLSGTVAAIKKLDSSDIYPDPAAFIATT